MLHNKKGAALLQVLLVTVVLAGMATMLLRASLSRTTTSRQTRRAVASQLLINACQAEVNALWGVKSRDRFVKDLASCLMSCKCTPAQEDAGTCTCSVGTNASRSYTCTPVEVGSGTGKITYTVTATFTGSTNANGQCELHYTLNDDIAAATSTEVVL